MNKGCEKRKFFTAFNYGSRYIKTGEVTLRVDKAV